MSDHDSLLPAPSRRRFLKTLGLTAGGLATAGMGLSAAAHLWGSPARAPASAVALRVGVLTPGPEVGSSSEASLMTGLRLGLAEAEGIAGELLAERIGAGPVLALERLRKLISEDRVDVVVGIVGPSVSAQLRDLLEETRTCLVVGDGGADVVRPEDQSPYVFHNSLGTWQASWAMGQWAGRNLGRRAVVASSFYESGYDAPYAFRLGIESAGGHVADTVVSGVPTDPSDLGGVIDSIEAARPDLVYALYSGSSGVDFLQAYAGSGLQRRVPLVASGFMVDEAILPTLGEAAMGVRSCSPWAIGLPTPRNQDFVDVYRQATGRAPDGFAVLGYDMAHWIAQGACARRGGLREGLATAEFSSPRGTFTVDAATGCGRTPLYLREVQSRCGLLSNVVLGELESITPTDHRVEPIRVAMKTGWLNPYLRA